MGWWKQHRFELCLALTPLGLEAVQASHTLMTPLAAAQGSHAASLACLPSVRRANAGHDEGQLTPGEAGMLIHQKDRIPISHYWGPGNGSTAIVSARQGQRAGCCRQGC